MRPSSTDDLRDFVAGRNKKFPVPSPGTGNLLCVPENDFPYSINKNNMPWSSQAKKKSEALKIFGSWTDRGLPAWAKSTRIKLDLGADQPASIYK
jgi:hypothetical protein